MTTSKTAYVTNRIKAIEQNRIKAVLDWFMHVSSQITKCNWFSRMKEELDELSVSIEPLNRFDIIRSTEAATCMNFNLREIYVLTL